MALLFCLQKCGCRHCFIINEENKPDKNLTRLQCYSNIRELALNVDKVHLKFVFFRLNKKFLPNTMQPEQIPHRSRVHFVEAFFF